MKDVFPSVSHNNRQASWQRLRGASWKTFLKQAFLLQGKAWLVERVVRPPLLNKSSRSSGFPQCIITEETEACNDLGPHIGLEVKHRFSLQTGRKELCLEDVALP